jgi:tRNA(fMet)-specific endonuclease VapC
MEVKILLDTSAYSGFRTGVPAVVKKIHDSDLVLVSPVVLGELIYGFRNGSKFSRNMELLNRFLESDAVEVVPVGEVTADRYSRIVLQLRKEGKPVPSNDIWIAAQAMEHGADLLTSDSHFERISGLVCTTF